MSCSSSETALAQRSVHPHSCKKKDKLKASNIFQENKNYSKPKTNGRLTWTHLPPLLALSRTAKLGRHFHAPISPFKCNSFRIMSGIEKLLHCVRGTALQSLHFTRRRETWHERRQSCLQACSFVGILACSDSSIVLLIERGCINWRVYDIAIYDNKSIQYVYHNYFILRHGHTVGCLSWLVFLAFFPSRFEYAV